MRGKAMLGKAVLFVTMCTLSFAIPAEANRAKDAPSSKGTAEDLVGSPQPGHMKNSSHAYIKSKRAVGLLMAYGYYAHSMLSHGASAQQPIHAGIRALQQDGNNTLAPTHALNNSLVDIVEPAKGRFSEAIQAVIYPYGKAYESTKAARTDRLAQKERLAQKAGADLDPFIGWSPEGATEKHGELSESTMPAFEGMVLCHGRRETEEWEHPGVSEVYPDGVIAGWLHIGADPKSMPDMVMDLTKKSTIHMAHKFRVVYAIRCPLEVYQSDGFVANVKKWVGADHSPPLAEGEIVTQSTLSGRSKKRRVEPLLSPEGRPLPLSDGAKTYYESGMMKKVVDVVARDTSYLHPSVPRFVADNLLMLGWRYRWDLEKWVREKFGPNWRLMRFDRDTTAVLDWDSKWWDEIKAFMDSETHGQDRDHPEFAAHLKQRWHWTVDGYGAAVVYVGREGEEEEEDVAPDVVGHYAYREGKIEHAEHVAHSKVNVATGGTEDDIKAHCDSNPNCLGYWKGRYFASIIFGELEPAVERDDYGVHTWFIGSPDSSVLSVMVRTEA